MNRTHRDMKAIAMPFLRPVAVPAHLLRKFWRDECPQRAASLAYTTLLSLVPFLAVAFAMLKAFGGLTSIQERLEDLIYSNLVTSSSEQAAEYIERFIERAHAGAIGSVGFLAFIITSVSVLNTVAGTFHRVWGAEDRRSVKDRFLTFLALIILGPVLFGASISLTGTILRSAIGGWGLIPGVGPGLALLVPLLLTWAGFLLLYEAIPSVPLRLRPALLGSFAASGVWELVKVGFEWYVRNVVNYGKVYASLSVLPIFLLWLYVSWLIALFGFEISYFLQHPGAWQRSDEGTMTPRANPVQEAVRAFFIVAEAFAKGSGPVTAGQVAQQGLLPEGSAWASLAELERLGYVTRVAAPPEAYLPCRAPTHVRVVDLWQALGGNIPTSEAGPFDRLLMVVAEATTQALGTTTVQDLLDAGSASLRGPTAGLA